MLGSHDEDEHPHAFALAGLLLTAGADANDGQLLYDRQFGRDDRHLALLFEHGLGHGDGGPWAARFGDKADSPRELLRGQLWWAIVHDMGDRVRLLVRHGADIRTPYAAPGGRPTALRTSDGLTPVLIVHATILGSAGMPSTGDLAMLTAPNSNGTGFAGTALAADANGGYLYFGAFDGIYRMACNITACGQPELFVPGALATALAFDGEFLYYGDQNGGANGGPGLKKIAK